MFEKYEWYKPTVVIGDLVDFGKEFTGKLFLYNKDKLIAYGYGKLKNHENIISVQSQFDIVNKLNQMPTTNTITLKAEDCSKQYDYVFIPMETLKYNWISGKCQITGDMSFCFAELPLTFKIKALTINDSICSCGVDLRDLPIDKESRGKSNVNDN